MWYVQKWIMSRETWKTLRKVKGMATEQEAVRRAESLTDFEKVKHRAVELDHAPVAQPRREPFTPRGWWTGGGGRF